ncbi:MAG: hypothetical protein AB7P69_28265 [Candidatus Binatia bacterium]
MQVLGIYREAIFSPGRMSDDTLILEATAAALRQHGLDVCLRRAETLADEAPRPQVIFSMAQGEPILLMLQRWQDQGSVVINNAAAVWNCRRARTLELCRAAGVLLPESWTAPTAIPLPEIKRRRLPHALWVKRADMHALQLDDVVYLQDQATLPDALFAFACRGVTEVILQAHCPGLVIKFYGVGPGRFFDCSDAGRPVRERLISLASQAAHTVGLEIFGGDCVLREDGAPVLIDLNDWPSFARCRQAAAQAIADLILERIQREL